MGFNTRLYGLHFFVFDSEGILWYTLYIIYTREVIVFAMRTDLLFLLP